MKNPLRLLRGNTLLAGSLVMILGSNLVNFLGYIYHSILGRMLGPASYGELAALFSLMGLIAMVPTSVGLTITKFVSAARTDKETNQLIIWLYHRSRLISVLIFLITLALSPFLKSFLNISEIYLIWLIAAALMFAIPAFFNRSILQGLLMFKESVSSVVVENLIKVIGGVILVYLGFSVFGAMAAVVVAIIVGWVISWVYINRHIKEGVKGEMQIKPMLKFTFPVLIQTIATTSIYSTDIVLVKHFFSAEQAGAYAAISTISKIIFFASGPIGSVMFPLISKRNAGGDDYKTVFSYSLLMTAAISLIILGFYYFLPNLAIWLLYGSAYLQYSYLLFPFGVFISLFTLTNLLLSFCLSVNKTRAVFVALGSAVLQAVGIWRYHDSLLQVITVSIIISLIMFLSLLIYSNRIVSLSKVVKGRYINN